MRTNYLVFFKTKNIIMKYLLKVGYFYVDIYFSLYFLCSHLSLFLKITIFSVLYSTFLTRVAPPLKLWIIGLCLLIKVGLVSKKGWYCLKELLFMLEFLPRRVHQCTCCEYFASLSLQLFFNNT